LEEELLLVGQLRKFLRAVAGDDGQALVEYALILLLVALFAIPMLTTMGSDIGSFFTAVSTALLTAL
jgi:Flp pilus assembly pilin Flp